MSLAVPIFPGFKPGKSYVAPGLPVGAPTWSYKETRSFKNFEQVSVSGRSTVTSYWSNPLRIFEWKYGYIFNNPVNHNPFYPVAIPHTDYEMLMGFFTGMQGIANQFAYTPPSYQVGGTWSVGGVTLTGSQVTFSSLPAGTAAALASKIGLPLIPYNTLSAAINGKYMYIASVDLVSNTVTCTFTASANTYGAGGIITTGQTLSNLDANGNTELVYTSGSYPNLTGQTYAGTVVPVTESVQLIDAPTLVVYDGTGANITSHMTLIAPNSVSPPLSYTPYVGYVLEFAAYTPAAYPLTASFNMYYLCRFAEDELETENFLTMLELASTVKFKQVRT